MHCRLLPNQARYDCAYDFQLFLEPKRIHVGSQCFEIELHYFRFNKKKKCIFVRAFTLNPQDSYSYEKSLLDSSSNLGPNFFMKKKKAFVRYGGLNRVPQLSI